MVLSFRMGFPILETVSPVLSKMDISLCITTYNSVLRLGKVLRHLTDLDRLPKEVVICDDGSGEETFELIRSTASDFPVPLRHLWHEDNGWRVSKARNMGIREAAGDYLVFIDGDCVPHRKFITDHMRLAERGYMVFGDRIHVREPFIENFSHSLTKVVVFMLLNRLKKRNIAIRNPYEKPRIYKLGDVSPAALADLAIGCNIAFWKEDAERVNGFNEALTGWGLEDIEFASRLLFSGVSAKKVRRLAMVCHLDHASNYRELTGMLEPVEQVFRMKTVRTEKGLNN